MSVDIAKVRESLGESLDASKRVEKAIAGVDDAKLEFNESLDRLSALLDQRDSSVEG